MSANRNQRLRADALLLTNAELSYDTHAGVHVLECTLCHRVWEVELPATLADLLEAFAEIDAQCDGIHDH